MTTAAAVAYARREAPTWSMGEQARAAYALRMAMGDGPWMAVAAFAGAVIARLFDLLRHKGDQKAEGVRWFVTQLQGALKERDEKINSLAHHVEELYELIRALENEKRELQAAVFQATEERGRLRQDADELRTSLRAHGIECPSHCDREDP
jgi:outer membrane murein-binding lipoprotein Lpp